MVDAEVEKLKKLGMKETYMLPEDAKKINILFAEGKWQIALKKNRNDAERLKELATRQGLLR